MLLTWAPKFFWMLITLITQAGLIHSTLTRTYVSHATVTEAFK